MRSLFPLALTAVLCAACAPSINPQMQAATDSLVAQTKGQANEPAPSAYVPTPWAAGQWAAFRMLSKEKQPSFSKLSVLPGNGSELWVETESQDYYQHSTTRVLYSAMPRSADEGVDNMLKVVTRKEGEQEVVTDFGPQGGPGAAFAKSFMKQHAANVVAPADVSSAPKEDVTVPAGTFRGCARYTATYYFGPLSKTVTGWFHPAVPINGLVKAESVEGDFSMELLDFGTP